MKTFRCDVCKRLVSEKELGDLQKWALANGRPFYCPCNSGQLREEWFRIVQLPHKPSVMPHAKGNGTDG